MIFKEGMQCPVCATTDTQSVLEKTVEDEDVLQCPNPICLMMFINLPDGQQMSAHLRASVLH